MIESYANDLIKIGLEAGFSQVAMLSTEKFVFKPEYRKFCEDNLCGNYGKNYGCPPVCGTPEEMKEKAMQYPFGLIMQSKTEVDNAFDEEITKALKKKHTAMTLKAIKKIQEKYEIKGIPIMAGPCNYCSVCEIQNQRECPREELRFSCLSAYCIDVNCLAKDSNIDISWNGKEVSLFSIYLMGRF